MISTAEHKLIDNFLDQLAELFDQGESLSPDTLFETSDGYAVTAEAMLRNIRLHESLKKLENVTA